MSSTPTGTMANEVKSPTYMSELTPGLQQPYVSRSNTIQTLPPPQSASLTNGGASSQLYSHPLNYPGQNGTNTSLQSQSKTSFQRFGYAGNEPFNYPTLAQPQTTQTSQNSQNSQTSQKFSSLSQTPLQGLPQTGYPLSTPGFSMNSEKSSPQSFLSPQGSYQSFVHSDSSSQSQFAAHEADAKNSLPNPAASMNLASSLNSGTPVNSGTPLNSGTPVNQGTPVNPGTPMNSSQAQMYSKMGSYSPGEPDTLKSLDNHSYNQPPKFIHTRPSKNPKDPKLSKLKFNHAITPSMHSETNSVKPYECTYEDCKWSFARQSDLRRHAKSHNAPNFHCPYWKNDPTCHRNGGSFSRLDVLKRHLRLVHYIKEKKRTYTNTDPGWCRACQKMFETSKSFIEHCEECASHAAPAEWKSNTSNDPTGTMNE